MGNGQWAIVGDWVIFTVLSQARFINVRLLIAEQKQATPSQIALTWLNPGLFRFQAPQSYIAWMKILALSPLKSHLTICATLITQQPRSQGKAIAIPKSWSK